MFNSQSNTIAPDTQSSSSFLRRVAIRCEREADFLFAQAETSKLFGNAEAAVRKTAQAVAMLDQAELLRAQAKRAAEMEQDAREMQSEGFAWCEIAAYLNRTYGGTVRND